MIRLSSLLTLLVLGIAQDLCAIKQISATDSLVDVFPLSIGNQWKYKYDYEYRDDPQTSVEYQYSDTGVVALRVITKVVAVDSTCWFLHEIGNHWTHYNDSPWSDLLIQTDTIQIMELHSGNHELCRVDRLTGMQGSVLPFLPNLADTARVYRYTQVNSAGYKNFMSRESSGGNEFSFSFKQGIGLFSVGKIEGCTCTRFYWTSHSLRSSTITGVTDSYNNIFPKSYSLSQNYPNPFNPSTTISFNLPSRSFVLLKVFDLIGREVAAIISEEMQPGSYSRQWNAVDLPSGIYFYRLQVGLFSETKKLILLK